MRIELPCFRLIIELGSEDPERPGALMSMRMQRARYSAAHACAGVDVVCPAYVEGIETAVEACGNSL